MTVSMIRHQHCERTAAKSILLKTQRRPRAYCNLQDRGTVYVESAYNAYTWPKQQQRMVSEADDDIRLLGSIYPKDHCAVATMAPKRGWDLSNDTCISIVCDLVTKFSLSHMPVWVYLAAYTNHEKSALSALLRWMKLFQSFKKSQDQDQHCLLRQTTGHPSSRMRFQIINPAQQPPWAHSAFQDKIRRSQNKRRILQYTRECRSTQHSRSVES